jgi:hypothetical protein
MTNFSKDAYRWFCRDAEQKKIERQSRLDYMMVRQACIHKLISDGGITDTNEMRTRVAECVGTYHPGLNADSSQRECTVVKPYVPPEHYDVVI